jgi:urocanate hydratase
MAIDSELPPAYDFALQVERLYKALILHADADSGRIPEPDLGGKLLYAGELAQGRALVVAGNIAGAATLAASTDAAAQKQSVREGVVDFLVTSLDEALRILKNELRKRETVAVCVAVAPSAVAREMLERGVLPDLLAADATDRAECEAFLSQGARRIERFDAEENQTLLTWRVAAAPAQWLPKVDAIALNCLSPADLPARRWLRLAPRYLGRLAQGMRLLRCAAPTALEFRSRVRTAMDRGEIGVPVEMHLIRGDEPVRCQFIPPIR